MSPPAVQSYMQSLLQNLPWPATMTGLAPLQAYITPPNPNVQSEIPVAYIWPQRGRVTRDTDKLKAGTVPRAATPGGPSGTKAVEYTMTVWVVWMMSTDDPDVDSLFPGMYWQVLNVLQGAAFAADGVSFSQNPVRLTDPWTSQQSWLVDLGEDLSFETFERLLQDQAFMRLDCVIECPVVEVIAA